jgi:hypothetical protein
VEEDETRVVHDEDDIDDSLEKDVYVIEEAVDKYGTRRRHCLLARACVKFCVVRTLR